MKIKGKYRRKGEDERKFQAKDEPNKRVDEKQISE